jgi:hypothetical protein
MVSLIFEDWSSIPTIMTCLRSEFSFHLLDHLSAVVTWFHFQVNSTTDQLGCRTSVLFSTMAPVVQQVNMYVNQLACVFFVQWQQICWLYSHDQRTFVTCRPLLHYCLITSTCLSDLSFGDKNF